MKATDKKAREQYLERLRLIKEGAAANPFESSDDQAERIAKAKKDVRYMVSYYLPHYATADSADFHIELATIVKNNKKCRVLVVWGRALAKSVWCNTIIPLWLWMRGEFMYVVIVGNNLDKAKILLSDVQAEFEANPRLIHDFGEQKLQGDWADGDFTTRDGRFMGKALGMGQSPRGLRKGAIRPNYISADDLEDKDTIKNPKRQDEVVEWIEGDLLPTMDGPVRRYVHPNNNFAPRTIQSRLFKLHPKWKWHQVNAYDPVTFKPRWWQKYDDNYFREIHEDGALTAMAEYNNTPHREGKIFKDKYFRWEKLPRIDSYDAIIGYWDVAYTDNDTSDYNAIKIWGKKGDNYYLIKAFVRQCEPVDAVDWIYMFHRTLPSSVKERIMYWYEAQFWTDAMKLSLATVKKKWKGRIENVPIVQCEDRPKGNKYDRMVTMLAFYQQGVIIYNRNEESSEDMKVGNAQLKGLEPGYNTHDDSPDADHGAITKLNEIYTAPPDESTASGGNRRSNHH